MTSLHVCMGEAQAQECAWGRHRTTIVCMAGRHVWSGCSLHRHC